MRKIGLIILLFINLIVFGQKPGSSWTYIDGGIRIFYDCINKYYSFDLVGDKIIPQGKGLAIVDNKIIQTKNVQLPINEEKLNDSIYYLSSLMVFRDMEFDYYKEKLKKDISQGISKSIKINDHIWYYYEFIMNDNNSNIKKQLYLITICYDEIFVLNCPIDNQSSELLYYQFMQETAQTVRFVDEKLNMDKIVRKLKK